MYSSIPSTTAAPTSNERPRTVFEPLITDMQDAVIDADVLLKSAVKRGRASMRQANAQVDRVQDAALLGGKTVVRSTGRYLRRHPWSAVGVSVAFGVLVGLLFKRR